MQKERKILGVSKTVFTLGIVSLFTDISSEMLVPIIPQFLKFAIGTPIAYIGWIEGVAESLASILRVWAGYLADKIGRPKLLTVFGYGISAASKPFLVLATAWTHVFGVRFADRFGKGIRSAPRDVLIADTTPQSERGRAFGLHRAMDTTGAMLGPLVVLLIVWLVAHHTNIKNLGTDRSLYTKIFITAAIPALLGWLVLLAFVKERPHEEHAAKKPELKLSALGTRFKVFLFVVTLFSIGNSSDAFLVLRATDPKSIGMGFMQFLWVYVIFNAISALVAVRSGVLSDKIGRKPVIITGWLVFAAVYFAIARVTTPTGIWVWFTIYGIYYGMTEGVLKAHAIDLAPSHLKGTAVGTYYTFTGLALLPASLIASQLWKHLGPSAPFYYGAATALLSAILMAALVKPRAETAE